MFSNAAPPTDALMPSAPNTIVCCANTSSHSKVAVATTSYAPAVMPPGSGQIVRRRRGRPCTTQLVARTAPSSTEPRLVPPERSASPMPLHADTVSLGATSLAFGSGRILPSRRRRTRIAIEAGAHSPVPSRRRKSSVYKGLEHNIASRS